MNIIRRIRSFDWFSALIAAPFAVVLAWVVTAALDREPPIRHDSARALADSVEAGGAIGVEFNVFRERICPAEVRRWLYDSAWNRHAIPSWTTGLELLAGREVYQRTITIPLAAQPGPAQYQVELDYECRLIQRILRWPVRVYSPPIKFTIAEGPP